MKWKQSEHPVPTAEPQGRRSGRSVMTATEKAAGGTMAYTAGGTMAYTAGR